MVPLLKSLERSLRSCYSLSKGLFDAFRPYIIFAILAKLVRLVYLRSQAKNLVFSEFQKCLEEGQVSKVQCAADSLSFYLKTDGSTLYETFIPGFLQKEDVWAMLNEKRRSSGLEISVSHFERYGRRIINTLMTVGPLVYFVYV